MRTSPPSTLAVPVLLLSAWAACAPAPDAEGDRSASGHAASCPRFRRAAGGLPPGEDWRFHAAVADVNGDGYLDLAADPRKGAGPRVYLYEGNGNWRESSDGLTVEGSSCGGGAAFADMDGKEGIDLLIADHCSGLYLFLGDGKGGWRHSPAAFADPSSKHGMNDLAVGDLNLDGVPDVVGLSSFRRGLAVFRGDGSGRWVERETNLPDAGGGYRVELADLNGDGFPDLLTTHQISTSRSAAPDWDRASPVWLGSGGDHWTPAGTFPDEFRAFDLVVARSPAEGDRGILVSGLGKRGGMHLFPWDAGRGALGDEGVAWILPLGPEYGCSGLALADFSGDGLEDLAVGRYQHGTVQLFLAGADGRWMECPPETLDTGGVDTAVWDLRSADVDGDSRVDLIGLQGSEGEGMIQVWIQD